MTSLYEPFSLGRMKLRNRIVKSATVENMATLAGMPTADTRRFYERLANGGAGLLITGFAYVNQAGQSMALQNGIHVDGVVPGWREIADAVHERGAKIAMQIAHGGRQTNVKELGGRQAAAPSAVPNLLYFTRPRAMTEEEIWQTIRDFGAAAGRVKAAGFDAVQIHAAHGYLISGFLSPLINRRRDDWGGDRERRFRFLAEVYRAVRQEVGPDFPVLCKLNMDEFVWVGLTPRDSFPAARSLAELGLDGLEISGGIHETATSMSRGDAPVRVVGRNRSRLVQLYLWIAFNAQKPRSRPREAYFLPYAIQLKPTLSTPLILVGGLRRPETAESILAAGQADMISLARPLIREPGLPNRWIKGDRRPAQCQSCNRCLGEIVQSNKLRCYRRSDES
jgi:2,4-dienoyl-CoA reductase-like NADH-dependent reductase (Old Yellow Enzyme family)